ncbi:MAG: site-specific DNA-methyltransferase [Planctomycetes bacterium]|nr:site-specific DNA-methyltransferase [Planctomycetota bacterium]
MEKKQRAPRNRTLSLTDEETAFYRSRLLGLCEPVTPASVLNRTICQDVLNAVRFLPDRFVDLLVIDPPYNLSKNFNQTQFKKRPMDEYASWLETHLEALRRTLKATASVYICSEWSSSSAVYQAAEKYFIVRNRLTWEREKGRGALANWKNCSEDIWFCTVSDEYVFNVDAVKLKRKVVAPYTDNEGSPKDWDSTSAGNFRLTHPSNLWTDITVPFWSMPENTDHPTQKPEKLIAKIVLASSNPGDVVLDGFLGSGTTSVVAKKLERNYIGIEIEEAYCCLAEKRLDLAVHDSSIQGYHDGVFWERNSLAVQKGNGAHGRRQPSQSNSLFSEEL